jgi:5-methylcytosine-specific restriction endonuclease McrA
VRLSVGRREPLIDTTGKAGTADGRRVVRRPDHWQSYVDEVTVSRSRKARAATRRKRRMDRVAHDLTDAQWTTLQATWGGCAYCGATDEPLQRDCVLPISRGGRYTLDNVVPACRSCNASKCNAEVTGWLRRKRMDERAFLARHVEIRTELELQLLAPSGGAPTPYP